MHTYDAYSRTPYTSAIPPMRMPHEPVGGSPTPIYDALCAEYRRLFRALPGDRSGEEHLQFHALTRGWQPIAYSHGRHRDSSPVALPPGGSAEQQDNRMRGR